MLLLIKYLSLSISSIYICRKILNTKTLPLYLLNDLIFSISISLLIFVVSPTTFNYTFLIWLFCLALYLLFTLTQSLRLSILAIIMAIALSHLLLILSSLLVSITTILTFSENEPNRYITQIVVACIQNLFSILIFLPKRFQKGMFLLYTSTNAQTLLISLTLIFSFLLINTSKNDKKLFLIVMIFIYILGLFIFMYWRNTITRTYRDKLRDRDLDLLNKHLNKLEAEHKKMTEDKDELAKIVHRDNKLVPSMLQSVEDFLTNFPDATPQMKARGAEIVAELSKEAEDRKGILLRQDKKCATKLLEVGIPALDDLLKYMQEKALEKNIHLSTTADLGVADKIATTIDNKDLNTLVADLLENAIIASSYNQGTHVHFVIGYFGKHLVIHVHDSGIHFPKEVLLDLGITKHTTYADDGGSGIGLMEIFNFVRKYRASYIIDEYATPLGPYTKRVSIVFDKHSRFTLNTSRPKEEINFLRQRADLTINVNKESVAK